MLPLALSFLKGRLGGWAIAGIILVVLGAAIYVQGLRLDAAKAREKKAIAEASAYLAQRDQSLSLGRQKDALINQLTSDAESFKKAADAAAAELAERTTVGEKVIVEVQKEIERVAVPSDEVVSPALTAALDGLRRAASARATDRGPSAPAR